MEHRLLNSFQGINLCDGIDVRAGRHALASAVLSVGFYADTTPFPATRRCEKRVRGTKWRVPGAMCEVICLRPLTWTATVELHAADACCAAE